MNQKMMMNASYEQKSTVCLQQMADWLGQRAESIQQMVEPIAAYYSKVLEQPVSRRQTWLLLNAQAAFLLTVFPATCPLLLRTVFAAWLVDALLRCKREMGKA